MPRIFLISLLLLVALRFGVLAWKGYKSGQVKTASMWGQSLSRTTQPNLYWVTMGVHSFVVIGFVGCSIALATGIAPISN